MIIVPHSMSSTGRDWNSERLNDGPETHSHGPTSQSRVHGLCSLSAAPKPLMDIFVELFIAPKQQELAELLLRCEPFDLGFLSQSVRLDYLRIIL